MKSLSDFLGSFHVQMQSVLALMFSAASCYLWVTKGVVPQDLLLINGIVVAFYFGNKAKTGDTVPLAKPYIPDEQQQA